MSFPLYDILIKESHDIDLSLDQKKELMGLIPQLDDKGHQNIFTIIRIHGLKNSSGGIFDIPYDGQRNLGDVKFNLEKLPNIVKQMIYRFVKIHIDKLKEEQDRSTY